jgi:hypothetical protein
VSRLGELTAKVDAFFARVQDRHGADMQCGSGADCCHVRRRSRRSKRRRFASSWRAGVGSAARSPNQARPIGVPRSMPRAVQDLRGSPAGVPVARRADPDARGFAAGRAGVLSQLHPTGPDPDCILDQTTLLSAMVLAVDRDAGSSGDRVDLASLVAELAST